MDCTHEYGELGSWFSRTPESPESNGTKEQEVTEAAKPEVSAIENPSEAIMNQQN